VVCSPDSRSAVAGVHSACSTQLAAAADQVATVYFHKTLTAAQPLLKAYRVYAGPVRTADFADTVAWKDLQTSEYARWLLPAADLDLATASSTGYAAAGNFFKATFELASSASALPGLQLKWTASDSTFALASASAFALKVTRVSPTSTLSFESALDLSASSLQVDDASFTVSDAVLTDNAANPVAVSLFVHIDRLEWLFHITNPTPAATLVKTYSQV